MKRRIIDKRVKEKFMLDDAYLNGYAKLCGWKATLVYISLCRHVDKDQYCFPSESLMAKELSISVKSVMRGIGDLKKWNVIEISKERRKDGIWRNNSYVLLDKSVWNSKNNQEPIRDMDNQETAEPNTADSEGVNQEATSLSKETNNKGNTFNETHISNISVTGVEEIMKIFYRINPTLNWKNKTIRNACHEMIEKFSLDETKRMAEAVVSIQGHPYAPVATTPYEMKEKIAKFKIYFNRQNNERREVWKV